MSAPLQTYRNSDYTPLTLFDPRVFGAYLGSQLDFGFVTASTVSTLTDGNKDWPTNVLTGYYVKILTGSGAGQLRAINSNVSNKLTLASNWATTPESGSLYVIASTPGIGFEAGTNQNARVSLWNGVNEATLSAGGDGQGTTNKVLFTFAEAGFLNNAGVYDVLRGNVSLQNVSDTTTTTYTGPDIATENATDVLIMMNCTVLTGAGASYTPEIQWKDAAGTYNSLWKQNTAKTATANTVIALGVGASGAVVDAGAAGSIAGFGTVDSATANQLIQIPFAVPGTIRVVLTKASIGTITTSIQITGSGS